MREPTSDESNWEGMAASGSRETKEGRGDGVR